jgi:acyl transferase domain-containing protein
MRVVVVCPGRGSWGKPEMGSLARLHGAAPLLARFEAVRRAAGAVPLAALDGAAEFGAAHLDGRNAAALIAAATLLDAAAIRPGVEVVAVTGNSMGWYTALAVAGALAPEAGFRLADTMGRLMATHAPGGQIVIPHMGEDWLPDPARKAALLDRVAAVAARPGHDLALSIDLGGMLVLAGNEPGLAAIAAEVPRSGAFPLRLPGHAAFHTAAMAPVAAMGRAALADLAPAGPRLPLVDGRGVIWWPGATDPAALWGYTLGDQVTAPYDFTRAVAVAVREFAPDALVVTGPGTTTGGAVAQSLVLARWRGMRGREDFQRLQDARPMLIAMGRPDQRALVTEGGTTP